MHTFLIVLGIIVLILVLIGLLRWFFSDDVGFFESFFVWDLIGDVFSGLFDLLGDFFSSWRD